jgi:hypothetical protein
VIVGALIGLLVGMLLMAVSLSLVIDGNGTPAWLRLYGLVAFVATFGAAAGALVERIL